MSGIQSLLGKIALVTGASRGVGREIALGLAEQGCTVVLHSRSLAHTQKLSTELQARGAKVACYEAELSDPAQVLGLCRAIKKDWPRLDIIYNNAAIMTPYHSDWLIADPAEYDLSFRINTIAPVLISNFFLPAMLDQKWGRIVQLTSGIRDQPELMAYAASKAALDKVVYDTAPKLAGTGVTMHLLDPGWLKTDLGGPQAPGEVTSVMPGALVPVFLDSSKNGLLVRAQDYAGKDHSVWRG